MVLVIQLIGLVVCLGLLTLVVLQNAKKYNKTQMSTDARTLHERHEIIGEPVFRKTVSKTKQAFGGAKKRYVKTPSIN
jgi:preprotein translocase subunit SecG